jgi:hypothetical protein
MSNLNDILGTPEFSVDVQFSDLNFLARPQITDADRLAYLRYFQRIPANSVDPKLVVTEIPAFISELEANGGSSVAVYEPQDLVDLLTELLNQVDSGNVTTAMVQKTDELILSLLSAGVIKKPVFDQNLQAYVIELTDTITGGATPVAVAQLLAMNLRKWLDIPQTVSTVLDAVDAGEKAKIVDIREEFEVEPSSLQQLIRLEYVQHAHNMLADALAGLHDDLVNVDDITALLNDLQDILNQKSPEDRVTPEKLLELYGFKTDESIYTASIQEYAKKIASWEDQVFNPENGIGRIVDDLGSDSSGFIADYNAQFTTNYIPISDVAPDGIDLNPANGIITSTGSYLVREFLPLFPVQPGSLRVAVGGIGVDNLGQPITLVFADNGLGGIVDNSGIFGPGSSINYATGEIRLEFITPPADVSLVTINLNYNFSQPFSVTNETIGSSTDVDFIELNLNSVPILPGSIQITEGSSLKQVLGEDTFAAQGLPSLPEINLRHGIITPGSLFMTILGTDGVTVLTSYRDNGDGTITVNPNQPSQTVLGTVGSPIIDYSTGIIGGGAAIIPTLLPSGIGAGQKLVASYEHLSDARTLLDDGSGKLKTKIQDQPGVLVPDLSNATQTSFQFDVGNLVPGSVKILATISGNPTPQLLIDDGLGGISGLGSITDTQVFDSFTDEDELQNASFTLQSGAGTLIPGSVQIRSNDGHIWTDRGDLDGDGLGVFMITTDLPFTPTYEGTIVGSINYNTGQVTVSWPEKSNRQQIILNADFDFLGGGLGFSGNINYGTGVVTIPIGNVTSAIATELIGGDEGTIDYDTGVITVRPRTTYPPDYQVTYSPLTTIQSVIGEIAALGDGTNVITQAILGNQLVVPGSLVVSSLNESYVDNGEGNFNRRVFGQAAGTVVISQSQLNALNQGSDLNLPLDLPDIGTSRFIPGTVVLNFLSQGAIVETIIDDGLGSLVRTEVGQDGTREIVGTINYSNGNYTLFLVGGEPLIFPNNSSIFATYEASPPSITDTFASVPLATHYDITASGVPIDPGSVSILSGLLISPSLTAVVGGSVGTWTLTTPLPGTISGGFNTTPTGAINFIDQDGDLIGSNGRVIGTIDYATGEMKFNIAPDTFSSTTISVSYRSGTFSLIDNGNGGLTGLTSGAAGTTSGTINNVISLASGLVPGAVRITAPLGDVNNSLETFIDDGFGNLVGLDSNPFFVDAFSETNTADFAGDGSQVIAAGTTLSLGQDSIVPLTAIFNFNDFDRIKTNSADTTDFSVGGVYQTGIQFIVDNGLGQLSQAELMSQEFIQGTDGSNDDLTIVWGYRDNGTVVPPVRNSEQGVDGLPIAPGSFLLFVRGGTSATLGVSGPFDTPAAFFDPALLGTATPPTYLNGSPINLGDNEVFYSSRKQFVLPDTYPVPALRGQIVEGLIRMSDGATEDPPGRPFFVVVGEQEANSGAAYIRMRGDLGLIPDFWKDVDGNNDIRATWLALENTGLSNAGSIDYETGDYSFNFDIRKNNQDLDLAYTYGAGTTAGKIAGTIDYDTGLASFTTSLDTQVGQQYSVQYQSNGLGLIDTIDTAGITLGSPISFDSNGEDVLPGTFFVNIGGELFTDNALGQLVWSEDELVVIGSVNYTTPSITINTPVPLTSPIYTWSTTPPATAADIIIKVSISFGSIDYATGAVSFNSAAPLTNSVLLKYDRSIGSIDYVNGKFDLRFTNNLGVGEAVRVDYNYVDPFQIKNELAFPGGTGVGPVSYIANSSPIVPGSVKLTSGIKDVLTEVVAQGTGFEDLVNIFISNIPILPGSVVVSGLDTLGVPISFNDVQSLTDPSIGEFYNGVDLIGTVNYLTGQVQITLQTQVDSDISVEYHKAFSETVAIGNGGLTQSVSVFIANPPGTPGSMALSGIDLSGAPFSLFDVQSLTDSNIGEYFVGLTKVGEINYSTGLLTVNLGLQLASTLNIFYPSNFNQLIIENIVDDGNGNLSGPGIVSGTVNYESGLITVTFTQAITSAQNVLVSYENYQFPIPRIQTFVLENSLGKTTFNGRIDGSLLPVDLETLEFTDGNYRFVAKNSLGDLVPFPGDTSGDIFQLFRASYDPNGLPTTNSVGKINIITGEWELSFPEAPPPSFELEVSFQQLPPSFISDEVKTNNYFFLNGTLAPAGGLGGNIRVLPGTFLIDTAAGVNGYVFRDVNGDGILEATFNGSAFLPFPNSNILAGGGTIDYATGKYQLRFFKDPPEGISFIADYRYSSAGGLPSTADQLLAHLRARVQQAIATVADESDIKNRLQQILLDLNSVDTMDEYIADSENGQTDEFQRHLSTAIVSIQSLNDTKKEELREKLFTYEEYIKSASALIAKISQILEKMAANISR